MRGVQNGQRGIALLDESGILITKSSRSTHIACVQNRFLIIIPKIKIEKRKILAGLLLVCIIVGMILAVGYRSVEEETREIIWDIVKEPSQGINQVKFIYAEGTRNREYLVKKGTIISWLLDLELSEMDADEIAEERFMQVSAKTVFSLDSEDVLFLYYYNQPYILYKSDGEKHIYKISNMNKGTNEIWEDLLQGQ